MSEQAGIFVLPSRGNDPPRAIIFEIPEGLPEGIAIVPTEGMLVTWSRDVGTWLYPTGIPLEEELAEVITAHAKELGVKW